MPRRTFLIALVCSLLLHFGVIAAPGWHLPGETEPAAMLLQARLIPSAPRDLPPAAVPATPPRAKPAPRVPRIAPKPRQALPHTPMVARAGETSPSPTQEPPAQVPAGDHGAADVASDPAATALPGPPPAAASEEIDVLLPGEGRIRFDVILGSRGFVVGQAVATWHLDDKTYSIRNVAETVGLVSLFKRAKVTQTSEGLVSAAGLVPQEYALVRDDPTKIGEAVYFDWTARKIKSFRDGRQREAELLDGSYDILSLIYQFAWFPPKASPLEIPVATGKNYSTQYFEVLGEENLALRLGRFRTLHLRVGRSGDNITEVWLGLDYKNLPLRIRHTAKNGDVYEQQAVDVRYGDVSLSASPAQVPIN
ncbi:MAG: DUF3108 domain-containing protein [Rhodocyclaceae bacterium]